MDIATTMGTDARGQFGALLERHRGIVFKVANTYARDAEDRADLAQEIAAQLWRAWPSYDPARSLTTWMYRIALNVAISFLRSEGARRRDMVPFDEALHDTAIHDDPEGEQQLRVLDRVIARLEPLNRALLLLYLEERSHREIAEILGITETNVATKIGRLKQRIRNDMG
jgi:RNA polymerase sigma-70 factor (ECF subfamily)